MSVNARFFLVIALRWFFKTPVSEWRYL